MSFIFEKDKSNEINLRSRYFNANVKRKLNRKQYPIKAPTPIQYQRASGKIPRDFKIKTPIGSVELGGTYRTNVIRFSVFSEDQNKIPYLSCFSFKFSSFINIQEIVAYMSPTLP